MKFVREAFFLTALEDYFSLDSSIDSIPLRESLKELIAQYSKNQSIESIVDSLECFLRGERKIQSLNVNSADDYFLGLSFLSLYRLLNSDRDKDQRVSEILGDLKQDRIVDYIFNNGIQLNLNLRVFYASPCIFLNNAIANQENAPNIMIEYFRHFYAGLKSTSWHDSHINQPISFFGYWSFESAVLTKYLDLDDTDYANHMFYPRDLLKRSLLPTWHDGVVGRYARKKYQELKKSKVTKTSLVDLKQDDLEEFLAEMSKQFVLKQAFDPSLLDKVVNITSDLEKIEKSIDEDPEILRKFLFDMFTEVKNVSGIFENNTLKTEFADWSKELTLSLEEKFPELKGEKDIDEILKKFNLDSSYIEDFGKVQLVKIQDLARRYLLLHDKYTAEEEEFWEQVDELLLEMDGNDNRYFTELSDRLTAELKSDLKQEKYLSKFKFDLDDILKKK